MKIQCSCGAKLEFEVLPEMAHKPVRFVCPACGLDASEFVNELARNELAAAAANSEAAANRPAPAPGGQSQTPKVGEPNRGPVRVHLSKREPAQDSPAKTAEPVRLAGLPPGAPPEPAATPSDPADANGGVPCPKHPGEITVAKCFVCSKPICPKCMELFGYVCSPLCKAKAGSYGIELPVYAGQKSVVEARFWRRVSRAALAIGIVLAGLVGFWIWYAWVGALPKPIFAVRFKELAYSGQSCFCGNDQIVFLHGDTLARHDLKLKKEIWSRSLTDKKQIDAEVAAEIKALRGMAARARDEGFSGPRIPSDGGLARRLEREKAAELVLRVQGQSIWVAAPDKLVRYDWDTGQPAKELPRPPGYGNLIAVGGEWLLVAADPGKTTVTHIDLATGETREESTGTPNLAAASTNIVAKARPGANNSRNSATAGLPGTPGKDSGKPLDPVKVAEQAQHLSYPAQLALPATLSVGLNQERAMREMDDETPRLAQPAAVPAPPGETASLIPTKDGLEQVNVRLLESRMVRHNAMKAPPAKSALDGNVTAAGTTDVADEILNEIQRDRGGDSVVVDESRYQVTLRRLDSQESWSGEVIGPPSLFPLEHVNVLTANQRLLVFDKTNKLLWQTNLSFTVQGDLSALDADHAPYGQGPCVEHKDGLYVFDEGVLTAFDRTTGNVRWRLPSVGIIGLFFDDQDMLYINSTTASHESLKYSRQIDIAEKVGNIVLKLDSKNGRTLWTDEPRGLVNYVSGKYIFITRMNTPPPPDDEDEGSDLELLWSDPAFLRITRINPKDGQPMWEHFQQRGPLDVQFDKNRIRVVFRKEVQVLRFPSW